MWEVAFILEIIRYYSLLFLGLLGSKSIKKLFEDSENVRSKVYILTMENFKVWGATFLNLHITTIMVQQRTQFIFKKVATLSKSSGIFLWKKMKKIKPEIYLRKSIS